MLIGLISDTHIPDRAKEIPQKVIDAFKDVDLILHAGDLTSMKVIEELEKIAPTIVIQGNMDRINGIDLPKTKVITAEDLKIGLEKVITIQDEYSLLPVATRKVSFKEKTALNILDALEKSKAVPFERVLFALGIKFVGESVAKILANALHDIDHIIQATIEEMTQINEIGEKIALSVRSFFDDKRNIEIVNRLKNAGLQFIVEEKQTSDKEQVLAGKSFVVSGVFEHYSRDGIKETIEAYGGKNVSSISSKTDYVLAGDKMGPEKRKKAESLNIPIVTEAEFEKMIGIKRQEEFTGLLF